MKGSTSEASIYFHVRTVRQNQRAARRAAAASKDAGFWSQNKKEARAKRVFTFMCERYDKIKEQRGELLDFWSLNKGNL